MCVLLGRRSFPPHLFLIDYCTVHYNSTECQLQPKKIFETKKVSQIHDGCFGWVGVPCRESSEHVPHVLFCLGQILKQQKQRSLQQQGFVLSRTNNQPKRQAATDTSLHAFPSFVPTKIDNARAKKNLNWKIQLGQEGAGITRILSFTLKI